MPHLVNLQEIILLSLQPLPLGLIFLLITPENKHTTAEKVPPVLHKGDDDCPSSSQYAHHLPCLEHSCFLPKCGFAFTFEPFSLNRCFLGCVCQSFHFYTCSELWWDQMHSPAPGCFSCLSRKFWNLVPVSNPPQTPPAWCHLQI